jgi:Predicted N-acetylglucosamine kinase
MKYYLGIDGGGTKTKFTLCDKNGRLMTSSLQSTCHYLQCGLDGVTTVIKNGLIDCCKMAKIKSSEIAYAFVACAGYGDIEEDNSKIKQAVKKALHPISFRIGNDTENALAGSLAGHPGINIIAGTGSIGMGLSETHELVRCGGWHHAFGGDEGSAFYLASNLLRLFTRQSDGRDKKTLLYTYLKETMKWENDSDMLKQCVIEWNYDRTKIASLAKHVTNLADQGDIHAIKLFEDAAKELGDIIETIYHEIKANKVILVSYAGGVFNSKEHIIEPLKERLSNINVTLIPLH